MVAPVIADVTLGTMSSTATQAEMATLAEEVQKLGRMLECWRDGSTNRVNAGRFSKTDIEAKVIDVLTAIEAVWDVEMPLNPVA